MNKIQKTVLWGGIAIFVLIAISDVDVFHSAFDGSVWVDINFSEFVRISLALLAVTGGLLYTFKDKEKADKVWRWLQGKKSGGQTMGLNDEEKKCLQLLTKWSQEKKIVVVTRDEVIKELAVDGSKYKSIIKKLEELGAVYEVAQGMGQEYGEFFKIVDRSILQDIQRMIQGEKTNQ